MKLKKCDSKTLWQLFVTFFKIGLFTFGGGYAMISVISRETVNKHGWITDKDIMDMVIIAESTPGVIAVNSATFVGYKVGGFLGSLCATLGVVLPSFLIILLVSIFISAFRENKWIDAAFRGIRCAVVVLIFNAVRKLSKQLKVNVITVAVAAVAFILSVFTDFGVIYMILAGGVAGIIIAGVKESIRIKKDLLDESESSSDKE